MKQHSSRFLGAVIIGFTGLSPGPATAASPAIPPAFGPHVNLGPADFADARTWRSADRIVGTYYFYW